MLGVAGAHRFGVAAGAVRAGAVGATAARGRRAGAAVMPKHSGRYLKPGSGAIQAYDKPAGTPGKADEQTR
nr:hypothetical protein Ade03nite_77270 [Actinoplanes derwentensis]